MKIRPARTADAVHLAQAEYDTAAEQEGLLVAQPFEIPVEAFRAKILELSTVGLYVVLEDDEGCPRGHLFLERLGLEATRHVSRVTIVVHPGHTGKGYGRQLMEHAIAWARRAAIEKIELQVRSTNPRAIGLYESLGFVREGELKNRVKLKAGYAHDICMGLLLPGAGSRRP